MNDELCKYFKICTCGCSGESAEVGEIDELCNIGRLYAKLEKIKKICKQYEKSDAYFDLTFDVINDIYNVLEGAEE